MDLSDPQQWNAYSYAYNSPVSHADPTGEDPCPGGGGGCYWDGTTTQYDGVTPQQMAAARQMSQVITKQVATQVAEQAAAENTVRQEKERKQRECQASFWRRSMQKVADVGQARWKWATSPEGLGTLAGIAVGFGCTALTGGAGAVICGIAGGAVSGLVTGALKCRVGDKSHCGIGNLARDVGVGAVLGAVGGAAGAVPCADEPARRIRPHRDRRRRPHPEPAGPAPPSSPECRRWSPSPERPARSACPSPARSARRPLGTPGRTAVSSQQ